MSTPNEQNLTTSNATYASTFTHGALPLPPSRKLAVVTCMDARIDPAAAFGLPPGTAHIIRNAGGCASDPSTLRSLLISQHLLGTTEIHVVKHTGCGMLTFSNADAAAVVRGNVGEEKAREVEGTDFLPFKDLNEAVKKDVQWLRGRGALRSEGGISGWVYDVETGRVSKVV